MLALLTIAMAAAPSADPWSVTPDPGAPHTPIMFGEIEEAYPAAVGLGLDGLGITLCSGNLITPELVLTAAHCTADFPDDLVTAVGVAFFGTYPLASDTRPIAEVRVHPDYIRLDPQGTTLGENDVALIRLAEPADIDPVWFRTAPLDEAEAVGTPLLSVGWGVDEQGVSHIKRSAELLVDELDPMFLISRASANPGGTSICSGDSGGPQYLVGSDGSLEQWSVHSWASSRCRGESGSVRTDVVADWILEQVADVHGSADRCVAWSAYGDGACDTDCAQPDPDCPNAIAAIPLDGHGPPATQGVTGEGCQSARTDPMGWLAWLARR